jgi:predicted O-methyltransferase YrrM
VNDALDYILRKWDLNEHQPMPIKIPNTTRVTLAQLFKELEYRSGAEIGTLKGGYATTLAMNNPGVELFCIDSWSAYDDYKCHTNTAKLEMYHVRAKERLSPYPAVQLINKFSMDAVKDFKDESLDFVYIDANHEWPYVTQDIFYWAKKVRPGGIVSGHDYLNEPRLDGFVQVAAAVHGYTEAFGISPWFVVDECTLDKAGSFFWVKQ